MPKEWKKKQQNFGSYFDSLTRETAIYVVSTDGSKKEKKHMDSKCTAENKTKIYKANGFEREKKERDVIVLQNRRVF